MRHSSGSAWAMLAAALLLPLVSMAIVPFYDTSEPRYAEIARVMAEGGDWITPWFSPGVPFWGKPPLSFWAQALSMRLFGFTEFAARFPSWLCLLASIAILMAGLRSLHGPRIALLSSIVYSTCALVYIGSGAVLTDPFLALGTTLSLVSFAMAAQAGNRPARETAEPPASGSGSRGAPHPARWRYGFFIGVAIGLLAKGPLAAILVAGPICVWFALGRKTGIRAMPLPWGKGLCLVAALVLPWYALAEIKTPGFLDYFIVGEHFRRFLDPGWAGDLYGSAHRRAYGTIWLYWMQAAFPWSILAPAAAFGALASPRLRPALRSAAQAPLFSYWLAAAAFTPLFFTFSANILWTYALPSLAGFSVAAALLLDRLDRRLGASRRRLLAPASIVPAVVLALSVAAWAMPDLRNTERGLVRYASRHGGPALPLFYLPETPFSARFYSAGSVDGIEQAALENAAACGSRPFYLAVPRNRQAQVSNMLDEPLDVLYSNKRHILVKIAPRAARPCGPQPPSTAGIVLLGNHAPSLHR